MSRKAQALLELALFLGLMLMVLLAALSYQRNFREQSLSNIDVFKKAKDLADTNKFIRTDIDGKQILCSGAVVSYSLNADQQANRIFQGGQRRTSASSVSIYFSNDEDPPELEYSYYNYSDKLHDISFGDGEKKLFLDRPGSKDPEDGMKISTWDYILVAYPAIESLAGWLATKFTGGDNWVKAWGNWLEASRIAVAAILATRVGIALKEISDAEAERARLKTQDEQYGLWGWRVADEAHEGKELSGKKYVKVVRPQTWDVETAEPKSIHYTETQAGDKSTRNVTIGDSVTYIVYRRYDETTLDAVNGVSIPLAGHVFPVADRSVKTVFVDLSGSQSETWN